MILQACLNGGRPPGYHPLLPLAPTDVASDGARCVEAGAAELHVHPRGADGMESLHAVDETIRALRASCPGTLIGVSTGEWIEKDRGRTIAAIEGWSDLPDYASVNLAEEDAPAVIDALFRRGVGVEAGLASPGDAERLFSLAGHGRILRILIEIGEQDMAAAFSVADAIADVLHAGGMRKQILLHGFDATVWPFVNRAFERRWSTRIGLEDGRLMPDGTVAADNADLVRMAVASRKPVSNHGSSTL